VAEPERPLVPQRDEPANCWALLPLQARWVAEASVQQQAEAAREPQQPLAGALLCPVLQVSPSRFPVRCHLPADALRLLALEAWQPRGLWVPWRQWPGPKAAELRQSSVPDGVGAQSAVAQAAVEARNVVPVRPSWGRPSQKHRDSASPALAGPARAHPDWLAGWMQPSPRL
jgi:hypothetical protein